MSDIIQTLLQSIGSSIQGTVTAVSVYKAAKPFLDKVLGPSAEELGEVGRDYVKKLRTDRGAKVVEEASKIAVDANIDTQPVPPKILVPLLENASLEEDDFLSKTWAALLANAADPDSETKVQPSFIEIMKQLTHLEVRILTSLLDRVRVSSHEIAVPTDVLMDTPSTKAMLKDVPDDQFHVALDNLNRLSLCISQGIPGVNINSPASTDEEVLMKMARMLSPGHEFIRMTHLGMAFIGACTPPNAKG